MFNAMKSITKALIDKPGELKKFQNIIKALSNSDISLLSNSMKSIQEAGFGLKGMFAGLKTMFSGLGTVISAHPVGAAVAVLAARTIPVAISAFDDYIHKTERLIEAGQKAKQTISNTISAQV